MIRAYKYLFYTALRWQRRFSPNDMPEINAFLLMLFVTWWNLLVLVMIAECSFGVVLLPNLSKWQVLLAGVGVALPLYFLFLHRGVAKTIAAQFERESPRKARLHGTIVFCYFVVSFALLLIMAIIRARLFQTDERAA